VGAYSDRWEYLGAQEKNAAKKLIDEGNIWVWSGELYEDFCTKVSQMSGNRYVLPVYNGTTALNIAGFSLNLTAGDEVIIGSYGYMASASPILTTGATPVFCDVDRETLTVTSETISRKIWISLVYLHIRERIVGRNRTNQILISVVINKILILWNQKLNYQRKELLLELS
jgi:dTDP-4-amino-4,6-dideoxygalactose transaminase